MQPTLKKYFPVTKAVPTLKKRIPKDLLATIQSFLRETVQDEINSGKQHTMTEYLDIDLGVHGEDCYVVETNHGRFGPFRLPEQALRRAEAIVQAGTRRYVHVLVYDFRYLEDRTGNWCDVDCIFCNDPAEGLFEF